MFFWFIVFFVCAIGAEAQYPFLLSQSLQTLGQCLTEEDCSIFGANNSTLIALGLHCNEATSRCELADGRVVGPGFQLSCSYFNITMNYIKYPSFGLSNYVSPNPRAFSSDGIVVVNITYPSSMRQYQGVLRLYFWNSAGAPPFSTIIDDDNLTAFYNYTAEDNENLIGQISVNSPESIFYFRNLRATTKIIPALPGNFRYGLAYYDSSGCVLTAPPFRLEAAAGQLVVTPPAPNIVFGQPYPTPPATVGPLFLQNFTSFIDPSGRIAYFRAKTAWKFQNEPNGTGYRCIFGQVYDMTGRVLSSKVDEELSGSYGDPNGGLWFPPYNPTSGAATVFDDDSGYSKIAGFVRLQLGVGFCINYYAVDPNTNATVKRRHIMQDSLGVYEGFLAQNITLDLNKNTGAIPSYPMFDYGLSLYSAFNSSLMYYRLNDIMFNTFLFPETTLFKNPFGPAFPQYTPVDFTRAPSIAITDSSENDVGSNSMCHTDGAATIFYDYSAFNMSERYPNQAPSLFLYAVNTSTPALNMTLVAQRAPFILPGSFVVTSPGIYCLDMWHDLLDGLLYRLFLRSCFQVGMLSATATQLKSYFVVSALDPFPSSSLPYAGYGSYVFTDIYLGLPQILVIPKNNSNTLPPQVRVWFLRYAVDPDEEEQIRTYGATNLSVYKQDFSVLDVLTDYSVLYAGTMYTAYALTVSNFNKNQYYSIAYNGGGQVITEILIVDIELYIPEDASDVTAVVPEDVFYECGTRTPFQYIAEPTIQNVVTTATSVCPGVYVDVRTHSRGGFCMDVSNPFLDDLQGNIPPYKEPCTYFQDYYNIEDPLNPVFLYGVQNAYQAAIAPNILAKVVTHDIMGVIAETEFKITSLVSENSTQIVFLTPVPNCNIDGIQTAIYEFTLTGVVNVIDNNVTIPAIYGWEPLNVLAQAAYNPNSPFFNLPSECPLLQNGTMTEYQVFIYCHNVNTTIKPECTNCTNLPVVYENTNGTKLLMTPNVAIQWWDAYAWVPTPYFSEVTGRRVYCRFAKSLHAIIPDPMFLLVTNLRRIQRNGQQCLGLINCFAIDIDIFMDPIFSLYYPPSGIELTSIPAFGSSENVTALPPYEFIANVSHVVSLEQLYYFTLTYDDYFCPVTQSYLSTAVGQIIPLVRTTHSVCSSPTGTAVIYMNYVDPLLEFGTVVRQCMFWQGYVYQNLGPFFNFEIAVNVNQPLLLPYNPAFAIPPNQTRFYGVSSGLQRLVVYDQCEGTYPCPSVLPACVDLVDQTTLQVVGDRNSLIYEFQIAQFAAPGGGIVIDLIDSIYARCYTDTYYFTFTVYDDKGEDTGQPPQEQYGPYYATITEPLTGYVVYETKPQCIYDNYAGKWTGGIPLQTVGNPPTLEEVGYKVRLFTIDTFIRTGKEFGFRNSGNYTFTVRNCASGCIQTFLLPINMVNPFDIILSPVASQCSSGKLGLGSIVKSFSGGTPFLPGELPNSPFYYSDYDTTLHYAEYKTYWKTPLNPDNWLLLNLGVKNPAGNYSLMLVDRNDCPAFVNVTVPGPPPFKVELAGIDATCSTTDVTTVNFVVTQPGNGPPYYTGQKLTNVSIGQNITYAFANSFGSTLCFQLFDSAFCEYETPLCAYIPLPEVINVTTNKTDSCPNSNTGTATVVSVNGNTSLTGYTCLWQNTDSSAIVSYNSVQSCEQIAIPGGTELIVTVSSIIGCKGSSIVKINSRPPIVITQIYRTTMGQLDQRPCIDSALLTVTGGVYGPNYTVFLIDDVTHANLTYNNNYTINITHVCRSVQYVIGVKDKDGQCLQTYISKDPLIGFGDSIINPDIILPLGLPPPLPAQGGSFGVVEVYSNQPQTKVEKAKPIGKSLWPVWLLVSLMGLGTLIFVVVFACKTTPTHKKKR